MNSYPASSRAVFAVREAAADEEEAKLLLCWGLSTPPPPLFLILLSVTCTQCAQRTSANIRRVLPFSFTGQGTEAVLLIIYDWRLF